jgi:ribosomal protein L31
MVEGSNDWVVVNVLHENGGVVGFIEHVDVDDVSHPFWESGNINSHDR